MTLEQLDQYGKLKTRRGVLYRKTGECREEKVDCVTDIVEGSNREYPFQRVHFSIAGLDPEQLQHKTMQIRGWEREMDEIDADLKQVEEYIAGVADPIVKTAMELYYLSGSTWPMVSTEIYSNASNGNTLRMSVQRYVEKYPVNPDKE